MRRIGKVGFMKLSVIVLLTSLLLGACVDLGMTRRPLPDNVEVIVPESEGLKGWALSPGGDKIAYVSHIGTTSTRFLLLPTIGQKRKLENCRSFIWIDNDTLYCLDRFLIIAKNVDEVGTVPLKKVKAAEVDLPALLQAADQIYRFEGPRLSLNSTLLLRSTTDPNRNYLVEAVEDLDEVVQGYDVVTAPYLRLFGDLVEKVPSPDGAYYYSVRRTADDGHVLSIHDAGDDSQLIGFATDTLERIGLSGWAIDSSGVYFSVYSMSKFPNPTNLYKILKLKLPETEPENNAN